MSFSLLLYRNQKKQSTKVNDEKPANSDTSGMVTNSVWVMIIYCRAQWKESFSKHLWVAFVVFLAEMGRIPCCGRAESSSSNI